eukprot:gene11448-7940_t
MCICILAKLLMRIGSCIYNMISVCSFQEFVSVYFFYIYILCISCYVYTAVIIIIIIIIIIIL